MHSGVEEDNLGVLYRLESPYLPKHLGESGSMYQGSVGAVEGDVE